MNTLTEFMQWDKLCLKTAEIMRRDDSSMKWLIELIIATKKCIQFYEKSARKTELFNAKRPDEEAVRRYPDAIQSVRKAGKIQELNKQLKQAGIDEERDEFDTKGGNSKSAAKRDIETVNFSHGKQRVNPCSFCSKIGVPCYFRKGKNSGCCARCSAAHRACDKSNVGDESESELEDNRSKKRTSPDEERGGEKTNIEVSKRLRPMPSGETSGNKRRHIERESSPEAEDFTRNGVENVGTPTGIAVQAKSAISEQTEKLHSVAQDKRLERLRQMLRDRTRAIRERNTEAEVYLNDAQKALNNARALLHLSQAELSIIEKELE